MVFYIHYLFVIRLKTLQSTLYSSHFIEEETEVKYLVQDFPAWLSSLSKISQLLRSRSVCLRTRLAPTPGSGPWSWRRHGVASCPESLCLQPDLRLQQCELGVHDVQELIAQLQEGPHLDEVE